MSLFTEHDIYQETLAKLDFLERPTVLLIGKEYETLFDRELCDDLGIKVIYAEESSFEYVDNFDNYHGIVVSSKYSFLWSRILPEKDINAVNNSANRKIHKTIREKEEELLLKLPGGVAKKYSPICNLIEACERIVFN